MPCGFYLMLVFMFFMLEDSFHCYPCHHGLKLTSSTTLCSCTLDKYSTCNTTWTRSCLFFLKFVGIKHKKHNEHVLLLWSLTRSVWMLKSRLAELCNWIENHPYSNQQRWGRLLSSCGMKNWSQKTFFIHLCCHVKRFYFGFVTVKQIFLFPFLTLRKI